MEVVRRPPLVYVMRCKSWLTTAVWRRTWRSVFISSSCWRMWRSCWQQLSLKFFKLFRSKSRSFLTLWRCIKNPVAVLVTLFRYRMALCLFSDISCLILTRFRWRALMSRAWVFVFMIVQMCWSDIVQVWIEKSSLNRKFLEKKNVAHFLEKTVYYRLTSFSVINVLAPYARPILTGPSGINGRTVRTLDIILTYSALSCWTTFNRCRSAS